MQRKEKEQYIRYTFTPSSANPGEILRIDVPLLDRGVVLEPNSLKLMFELDIEMGSRLQIMQFLMYQEI